MAEEIRRKKIKLEPTPTLLKQWIFSTKEPLIFKNILSWDVLQWSVNDWIECLGSTKLDFRIGTKQCTKVPQWENKCETISASARDVLGGSRGSSCDMWMYFDYKHMNQHFKNKPDFLESLSWADFGLQEKSGKDSTIWIGTEGAYTPCHMDSYGCNIVAQVHGRKLWVLFPPSSTSVLKPTRVPYEESSIYSDIHFSCGRNISDDIGEARVVELLPGDVLVVPKHWWHYVENLSDAISVNMWIPRESDDASRLEEALVRFSMATMLKGLDVDTSCGTTSLLNPNEMDLLDERIDIRQISWCVEQAVAKEVGEDGSASSLTDDIDGVTSVPCVLASELRRTLLNKCGCDAELDNNHCDDPRPKPLTTEDVINAFCHPSVISQVAKLLIKTRKQ